MKELSMKPIQKPASVKTIPAIPVLQVVVTKNNVKQPVIKGGFQNLETIQMSLPKENWSP
jgi:hypothetical protein